MLPINLEPETLKLPETDRHSIVIITGNRLRHKRFANRIINEFGELVVGWYELDSSVKAKYSDEYCTQPYVAPVSKIRALGHLVKTELKSSIWKYGIFVTLSRIYTYGKRFVKNRLILKKYGKESFKAEKELFEKEVFESEGFSKLEPIRINPIDVHDEGFVIEIKKLNPYFFLTLGGPLYKKELLGVIRGVAINQHAGHSPDLKGSYTTEWALYHRSLNYVSSTIHITASGADSGPILRRSNPCIFQKDNIQKIVARTVALGTELMIEVVHEIIENKHVKTFKQPQKIGRTYLSKEFGPNIKYLLMRDLKTGWLREELNRLKDY